MKRYVLDTSVVVKWFSEHGEDDLDKALALRQGIFEGAFSVICPDLLFYELANALRYNPHLSSHDVSNAVQSALDMGFEVRTAEPAVFARAVEIAFKFNITVYDAYFLSLAHSENRPLITADDKLARRAKGSKYLMRIADFRV